MKKCPSCGFDLNENANFCNKCGSKLSQDPQTISSSTGHLKIRRKKGFAGCAISINVNVNNINYNMANGEELNFDLVPGSYQIAYKVWCRRQKEVTVEVTPNCDCCIEFVYDILWGGFKVSKNSKLK